VWCAMQRVTSDQTSQKAALFVLTAAKVMNRTTKNSSDTTLKLLIVKVLTFLPVSDRREICM
jgi:hypothetical protein